MVQGRCVMPGPLEVLTSISPPCTLYGVQVSFGLLTMCPPCPPPHPLTHTVQW
jgi:hypothetical protein